MKRIIDQNLTSVGQVAVAAMLGVVLKPFLKLVQVVLAGTVIGAAVSWWRKNQERAQGPDTEVAPVVPIKEEIAEPEVDAPVPHAPAAYEQLTPAATDAVAETAAEPKWIQPVDRMCPVTHQIKARFSTGRYHRPEDRGYSKVIADCCYATEEDAIADGFSKARW